MIDALSLATMDTETVGLEGHVYDIAWCIHNKRGDIRIERNFLVEENFTDPKKMMGAFYAASISPTTLECFKMVKLLSSLGLRLSASYERIFWCMA